MIFEKLQVMVDAQTSWSMDKGGDAVKTNQRDGVDCSSISTL